MEWLNYHHLLYFWMVAREGGLAPAGKRLRLSLPTLSGQIRKLEEALGERLFEKRGRKLALTEVGRMVFGYADEIFSLGGELLDVVRRRPEGKAVRLLVGIVDVVPKLLVRHLLAPALTLPDPVRLVCFEDTLPRLVEALGRHELDVIISDAPLPPGGVVRAYDHRLGESGLTVLGDRALARPRRAGFPGSLDGAPLLLPLPGSVLRRDLDAWFAKHHIQPRVVAEAEDSALLKSFAADGMGLMVAPTVVADVIADRYKLTAAGEIDEVRERYYAITGERRLVHPAVAAIQSRARAALFART